MSPQRRPPWSHTCMPRGCPDCEMERLTRWAYQRKIIDDDHLGPIAVVDTIIRLVNNMDEKIQKLRKAGNDKP